MGKCFSKPAYPLEICGPDETEPAFHPGEKIFSTRVADVALAQAFVTYAFSLSKNKLEGLFYILLEREQAESLFYKPTPWLPPN